MILVRLNHDEEMNCAVKALERAKGSEGMNDYSVQKLNLFQDIARNSEALGAENAVAKASVLSKLGLTAEEAAILLS